MAFAGDSTITSRFVLAEFGTALPGADGHVSNVTRAYAPSCAMRHPAVGLRHADRRHGTPKQKRYLPDLAIVSHRLPYLSRFVACR
ncbi:hypothetical protein GCM10010532_075430 [Dactylosporangium siamense]|uniref:Uncharacterized protein n=1 Tax=Dactylosporangium siamense TaxID=685454 RepID=A0A919PT21_9ACTN|nr:hypothetical protein Dsi01nite_058940 [Dactylosporangium siamense]